MRTLLTRLTLALSILLGAAVVPALASAHSGHLPAGGSDPAGPIDRIEPATRVVGTVVSGASGVPLSGVTVEVLENGHRVVTNQRGSFVLHRFPQDRDHVVVRFSRLGYRALEEHVTVDGVDVIHLEVALEPAAVALDAVAVLLERTRMVGDPLELDRIPGSAFHLNAADLERRSLAFGNVHDALREVPGVNVQDEEGYGLRPHIGLRGAGPERSSNVTVMEDGVLIAPAPYSAPAAYYFPTMGRMEAVEVRKGASQIRYGPRTLGGAVNLVTSSIPDRFRWHAELSGGGDATLRTRVRAGEGQGTVGWLVEGYQVRTDGFKDLQGGGDTGFSTTDLLAKVRLGTDPRSLEDPTRRYHELELKAGVQDHTSDETYLGLTEADFRTSPTLRYAASQLDVMDTDHRQLQARYFVQAGPRLDLAVTAYRHAFARNWYKLQSVDGSSIAGVLASPDQHPGGMAILQGADSPDDALELRANNREYLSRGVQTTAGLRLHGERVRHDVELGLRLHTDHEDRLQWEDGYRMQSGRMLLTSEGAPGSQANRRAQARAWAFHLQDEIRVGRLSMVPGVRYETVEFTRTDWAADDGGRTGEAQVRTNSVSALIPGVGLVWERSPWTHFFAGVHRGFGPPGPGADQQAQVEESRNWESGVRVRRAGVGLNVAAFYSDYSNVLGRATLATGESGSGELFNGGAVDILGLEAAVDLELARYLELPLQLPVRAAYTYNRGTFRSSFQSGYGPWGTVEEGDRIPYLPAHSFSGSAGVDPGLWSLTLSWNGTSAMRTEAGTGPIPQGTGTDRFLVFNLAGEVDLPGAGLLSGGSLYAGIQNLTDERYVVSRRPAGARPGLPRTLFVGVRMGR